jgi:hypothetical protein
MIDMRVCTTGVGFAAVACLATVALGQGGDNAGSAVPLAIGGSDTGTTVGYANDSDEVCPYTGSTSPDVYYSVVPGSSGPMTVDLCDSGYDTKTYVYDSGLALLSTSVFGNAACNDDACSSPGGGGFRSLLECVPVVAGFTYYVVVDGWGGDAGSYSISLSAGDPVACEPAGPCEVDCTGVDENEACNEGGDDTVNGGCNSPDQMAFGSVDCGTTVCGQSYFNGTLRDTDWFKNTQATSVTYNASIEAEFEAVFGRVDNGGVDDCAGVTAFAEVVVGTFGCEPLSFTTAELAAGTYWFFVGANFTATVTCATADDSEYAFTLECELGAPPCPWDFNGNGEVDFQDLLKLLAEWGPCPTA